MCAKLVKTILKMYHLKHQSKRFRNRIVNSQEYLLYLIALTQNYLQSLQFQRTTMERKPYFVTVVTASTSQFKTTISPIFFICQNCSIHVYIYMYIYNFKYNNLEYHVNIFNYLKKLSSLMSFKVHYLKLFVNNIVAAIEDQDDSKADRRREVCMY